MGRRITRWIGFHIPEALASRIGRAACRHLGWHGLSCRGRNDHNKPESWITHPILERWYL